MMRQRLELTLRATALVLLGWALWIAFVPRAVFAPSAISTTVGELDRVLPALTIAGDTAPVHAALDSAPDPVHLAWLAALRRGGVPSAWSGTIPAIALEARPSADPRGRAMISAAAPSGSRFAVSDDAGLLDSLTAEGTGASIAGTGLAGTAYAVLGRQRARAVQLDSIDIRRLLVLARAGWEAKFAIAALEETGWQVDARLAVGPGNDVVQGPPAGIDTARYAAVIALDSVAVRQAGAIIRYVRAGGGLVLAGEAAALPAFAALAPGAVGARRAPGAASVTTEAPRRALASLPLALMQSDAVLLEQDAGSPVAAARRVGAGRVVQVGWLESWRWRMTGGDDAPAAHRDWWAAVVGAAAYRPMVAREVEAGVFADPAPLARTVAALGPATAAPDQRTMVASSAGHDSLPGWILVAMSVLLLAEWGSRRLRGAT